MNNLESTKITININKTLLEQFSNGLDRCFIKRDAFLNNLISIEVDRFDEEMEGVKQSKKARKYLIENLKRSGTKAINVVVDKSVALRLNAIIKKHGMSRDCFVNRLLLLSTFPEGAKYELRMFSSISELYKEVQESSFDFYDSYVEGNEVSTSTLTGIHSYIIDPFKFLRTCIYHDEPSNSLYKKNFYLPKFFEAIEEKEKKWVKEGKISSREIDDYKTMLKVATCYIEDWELPSHSNYDKKIVQKKSSPPPKSLLEMIITKV